MSSHHRVWSRFNFQLSFAHTPYFLATDGRLRIDKTTIEGDRTSEILLPASRERIVLNHNARSAVRARDNSQLSAPPAGEPPEGLGSPPPSPAQSLGPRTIGPLTLIGFISHTPTSDGATVLNEWWIWASRGAPPQIIEMKSTGPDGNVDDRHITVARRTTLSDDVFQIPSAYSVREIR